MINLEGEKCLCQGGVLKDFRDEMRLEGVTLTCYIEGDFGEMCSASFDVNVCPICRRTLSKDDVITMVNNIVDKINSEGEK